MKRFISRVILALLLSFSANSLWAKPVDTIDSYGVYVVAEKGFVKIGPYSKT